MNFMSRRERFARKSTTKGVDDLLTVAEETSQPTVTSYSTPTPEQEAIGYKPRREHRLIPDQKPLNWFDELEKHVPLPRK
jgi:hypothetical protein